MLELSNHQPEDDALLFNAAARLLGQVGYRGIRFDIGGKKSKRRYIIATSSLDEEQTIWVKAATKWPDETRALRFPWKKLHGSPDGVRAVAVACDEAARRGATHLMAVSGEQSSQTLDVAQLYRLTDLPFLVERQSQIINSVFYRSHNSSLVMYSQSPEFEAAAFLATDLGVNLLKLGVSAPQLNAPPIRQTVARPRTDYARSARIRNLILELAQGKCECCSELGFLTHKGARFLETHHVVGVGERGPDEEGNIVALCPTCHRKAHFAADKVAVERKLLEALRRRDRRS